VTPEFEVVKQNFLTYFGRSFKNYSKIVIMKSSMTNIIHPTNWFEWEDTSFGLSPLFYKEYKNFGHGVNTSKRVTSDRFKVIMNVV